MIQNANWFPFFKWVYPKHYFLQLVARDLAVQVNHTFPPACPRTAKQNRVDSSVLPSILNCAKPAACPSMGWDTFLSTEYSCMAPTTRFCWRGETTRKLTVDSFCWQPSSLKLIGEKRDSARNFHVRINWKRQSYSQWSKKLEELASKCV